MSSNTQRLRPGHSAYRREQPVNAQRLTGQQADSVAWDSLAPGTLFFSDLGKDENTAQVLKLGDKERRSGLYVLGKTGMGKSTLLVNLALQDIAHGHGVFFLDPHADAIRDIMKRLPQERKNDVLFFTVTDETHSFGINLVACNERSNLEKREDTYAKAYQVFYSLWQHEWGPWLKLIITYLLRAFIENPDYTLAEAPKFLLEPDFRKQLVANIIYDSRVASFWQQQFSAHRVQEQEVRAALGRIDQFLSSSNVARVIGQKTTTLDFTSIMKERKIVLVSFPANLPNDIKRFLGTILVRELLWAARERKRDHSQFCVFVDEFQNFATPDFASIIRETRKFGIAPTLAQQVSLGKEYEGVGEVIDAMANKVVFQPTVKDAERDAKEFAKRPESAYLEELEPEEIERIVDEVEDGIEPILALAENPFDHLIRAHSNTQVSQLSGILRKLANAIEKAQAETEQASVWTQKVSSERVFRHRPDGEEGVEYVATREQMIHGKQLIETLIADVQHGTIAYGSFIMIDRLAEIAERLRAFIGFAQGATWETESDVIDISYTLYNSSGKQTIPREKAASKGWWGDMSLDSETERYMPDLIETIVSEVPAAYEEGADRRVDALSKDTAINRFAQARLLSYIQASEQERDEGDDYIYKKVHISLPKTIDATVDFFTLPAELPENRRHELMDQRITVIQQSQPIAQAETKRLNGFLSDLAALCMALSAPEQHIHVHSGQYQPRKSQRITYLTHQAKTMLHPQRPVSDMVAEKEIDLLNLAPYTAAYKLLSSGGGALQKGTLTTFNLPGTHDPLIAYGLRKYIVSATHRDYCLPREQIEREMKQRQGEVLELSSDTRPSAIPQEPEKKKRRQRSGREGE